MGKWTNFPFGLSVTTATGTVAGHINASTGSFSGLVTMGTCSAGSVIVTAGGTAGGTIVGERAYITGIATTVSTKVFATPFAGKIVDFIVTSNVASITVDFTVNAGSSLGAGTIAVATASYVVAVVAGQTRTAVTAVTIPTTSSILVTMGDAGSAATQSFCVVIEKTV